MRYILSVEDTKFFASLIKKRVEAQFDVKIILATSMAEAEEILASKKYNFFLALLDMKLPDALNGEVVDLVVSYDVPIIVFSGVFDVNIRDQVLSKPVIDYVLKDSTTSLDYLVITIKRIIRNSTTKVLCVDDSAVARRYVVDLLKQYRFQVYQASNGREALKVLQEHSDIKLMVTDYNMPLMDGVELTKEVRRLWPNNHLAIIGLSTTGNAILSARFLKSGGNDFLNKPFLREEFFCRINQNINLVEYVEELQEASLKDHLTGIANRRSFFDAGNRMYANAKRNGLSLTVAMLDIDHFKKVNDLYGHAMGDHVLQTVSKVLAGRCRDSDLIARVGGEEFAFIAVNMDKKFIEGFFDYLRESIAALVFKTDNGSFSVTVSIGISTEEKNSLDAMLNTADSALYSAKDSGRNCLVFA